MTLRTLDVALRRINVRRHQERQFLGAIQGIKIPDLREAKVEQPELRLTEDEDHIVASAMRKRIEALRQGGMGGG